MDLSTQHGYVYILTNVSLPGLVKIGMTRRDPFHRAAELRSTGVPTNFVVVAAVLVDDPERVESYLHRTFQDVRFKKDREFFRTDYKSVLDALIKNIGDIPQTDELSDSDSSFKWHLDIKLIFLLKRDLDENIDLRLKISRGENYLNELWTLAIEGDEKSRSEIIRLEEAGSVKVNAMLLNALLIGEIEADVSRLLTHIVNFVPHQIPDFIKKYPQHIIGLGEVYMRITDVSDDVSPKGHLISSFREPPLLLIILYSWDVIFAGGLDAERFARQLGQHLDLSQYVAEELNSILQEPWRIKSFINQDSLMQERLLTMKRLLTILAVLPLKT